MTCKGDRPHRVPFPTPGARGENLRPPRSGSPVTRRQKMNVVTFFPSMTVAPPGDPTPHFTTPGTTIFTETSLCSHVWFVEDPGALPTPGRTQRSPYLEYSKPNFTETGRGNYHPSSVPNKKSDLCFGPESRVIFRLGAQPGRYLSGASKLHPPSPTLPVPAGIPCFLLLRSHVTPTLPCLSASVVPVEEVRRSFLRTLSRTE